MANDLSTALAAAQTVATHQSAAVAMVKKSHDLEVVRASAGDSTARAAPPPGQGTVVDKIA